MSYGSSGFKRFKKELKKTQKSWIKIFLGVIVLLLSVSGFVAISKNTVQSKIHVSAPVNDKDILDQLVILPNGTYNQSQATRIMDDLKKIDPQVLNVLWQNGDKIKLLNTSLTADPEITKSGGSTISGDTVDTHTLGYTLDKTAYVRLDSIDIAPTSVAIHETGHLVNPLLTSSSQREFNTIFNHEAKQVFNGAFYKTYVQEYFAETFNLYFESDLTRTRLKAKAPETYKFMQSLEIKIVSGNRK